MGRYAVQQQIGEQLLQARMIKSRHPFVTGRDAKTTQQVYGQGPAVHDPRHESFHNT